MGGGFGRRTLTPPPPREPLHCTHSTAHGLKEGWEGGREGDANGGVQSALGCGERTCVVEGALWNIAHKSVMCPSPSHTPLGLTLEPPAWTAPPPPPKTRLPRRNPPKPTAGVPWVQWWWYSC